MSTVVAGTSSGSPAASQALRVMLIDCMPDLADASPDDLAHLGRVDPGALQDGPLDGPQHVDGVARWTGRRCASRTVSARPRR